LFFGPSANSRCPAAAGKPHTAEGGNYTLSGAAGTTIGQKGWRWCKNCAMLWFEASGSKCPATGSSHSKDKSGEYRLHTTAIDWQRNWRACGKCGGLFFGDNIQASRCAATAAGTGPHVMAQGDLAYMPNYFLQLTSDAPGQTGWAWCADCQCLWMGLNSGSVCPAGGVHLKANSGSYTVIEKADGAPGQSGWRWCHKCQGLWFSPFGAAMKCPANGSHAQTGGSYWVQFFGHD
jgi:hypothetical protein